LALKAMLSSELLAGDGVD